MKRKGDIFRWGKVMFIASGLMLSSCTAAIGKWNGIENASGQESESVSEQESESASDHERDQKQDGNIDKDEVRIELDVENKIYGTFDSVEEMNETLTKQLAERLLKEGRIEDEKQLFLAESKMNLIFVDQFFRECEGELEADPKHRIPYEMRWLSISDQGEICYYKADMDYYLVSEQDGDGEKAKIVIRKYHDQIIDKTANTKMAYALCGDWRSCMDEIVVNWKRTSPDKLEKLQDPITACEVLYNLENGYGEFHEYDEKSGGVIYRLNDGGKIFFEMHFDGFWKPERCTSQLDITSNERKKVIQNVTAKELKESEERFMLTNEYTWNELIGYYRLICRWKDRDAALYGVNGGDSLILRVENEVYPLDITWAEHYDDSVFSIMDCDQDGQDEFVYIHNIGGGTGRYLTALHVIDIIDGTARVSEFQCDAFDDQLRAAAPEESTYYDVFHYTLEEEKLLYRFSVRKGEFIGDLTGEILYHKDGSFSITDPEYIPTEQTLENEEADSTESDLQIQKGNWMKEDQVKSFYSGDFDGDGQEEFALICFGGISNEYEYLKVYDFVDGQIKKADEEGVFYPVATQLPHSCSINDEHKMCEVNGDSFIYTWPVERKISDGEYRKIGRIEANMKYEEDGVLHCEKCEWIITDQANVESLLMEQKLHSMTADELRKITKRVDKTKPSAGDYEKEVVIVDDIPELDICLYSIYCEGENSPSVLRYGNELYQVDIPSWSESIDHQLVCSKANGHIWYVDRKNQDGYECDRVTQIYNVSNRSVDQFDKTYVEIEDMPKDCEEGDFRIHVDDNGIFYDLSVVNKKDKRIVGHYSGVVLQNYSLLPSFVKSVYHENIDNDTVLLVDDPKEEISLYGKNTAEGKNSAVGKTTFLKVGEKEYDLHLDWIEMYPDLTVQAGDFDKDGQTEYAIIGREAENYLPKASLCIVEISGDKANVHVCDVRKCALEQHYISMGGAYEGEVLSISGFYADGDTIAYEYNLYWYDHVQGVIRGKIKYQDNGEILFDQGVVDTEIGQG